MRIVLLVLVVGCSGFALAADVLNPFAINKVTPAANDTHNLQLLASVRVGRNGGCSGTSFAADESHVFLASAAHCVRNNEAVVGQKVAICTVDGKIHDGEWVAVDKERDIAIAKYPRASALAITPIPEDTPMMDGNWTAVGFPRDSGFNPNFKTVGRASIITNTNVAAKRWLLPLKSGIFSGGDSGGGIFSGPNLVGVMTHGHDGGPIQAASHNQLVEVVSRVPSVAKAMGIPNCPDGVCEVCPKCGKMHSKLGWSPQPNTPIVLPKEVPRDGTFPDKTSSAFIVALVNRVDDLESRLAKLEKAASNDVAPPPPLPRDPPPVPKEGAVGATGPRGEKGDAGERGPAGKDGAAGRDGKSGVVTVVYTDANGHEISRANDVRPGSTVRLRETKALTKSK